METQSVLAAIRRPRFRRAAEPSAFRLTDDDVEIVRQLARHRFLRSTHIAALVGRSLDRVNDRLCHLYHAGYIDRPRAQLDYYATAGSAPMVYALADRGAPLLIERDGVEFANVEWSRKNRAADRPFIEHRLEIVDFQVALERATHTRDGVRLIPPDEIVASLPEPYRRSRNPFAIAVKVAHHGLFHEVGIVPDHVFGLEHSNGSRRNFMVEIDRGTMPVSRSDLRQTSIERKMRAYLAAHATKQHERRFGWRTFRVLTVTTDERRLRSMTNALRQIRVPNSPSAALFLFATRADARASNPLAQAWRDGTGRDVQLF